MTTRSTISQEIADRIAYRQAHASRAENARRDLGRLAEELPTISMRALVAELARIAETLRDIVPPLPGRGAGGRAVA